MNDVWVVQVKGASFGAPILCCAITTNMKPPRHVELLLWPSELWLSSKSCKILQRCDGDEEYFSPHHILMYQTSSHKVAEDTEQKSVSIQPYEVNYLYFILAYSLA